MTRAIPRTNFHGSTLIRCLADLSLVDAVDAGDGFAEKLGEWVHFTDAITLSAVHADGVVHSASRQPQAQTEARIEARNAAATELERLQEFLVNSITRSCSPKPDRSHIKLPEAPDELPAEASAMTSAYAPYRRFYEAHQRDMELSIQPLRVNLRESLAKLSPAQRKLAELDAAFERVLRDREAKLLSKVPQLLKKRFEKLCKEHRHALAESGQQDNRAGWMQPNAWLARFCGEMQALLLAELDFRLQPVMGLAESFT